MNRPSNGGARVARPTLQYAFITLFALTLVLCTTPARAMHLPEGVLSANWAVAWFLASAPFVFWGLRTIQRRRAEDAARRTAQEL